VLPILKELLFHHDWELKESGILVLGAIAEGLYHRCYFNNNVESDVQFVAIDT
jgi:hypothetical protein